MNYESQISGSGNPEPSATGGSSSASKAPISSRSRKSVADVAIDRIAPLLLVLVALGLKRYVE
jgi:hypothetical protein